MTEDGPGLIREVLKDSSQVDLVVFRQMDRISMPTFLKECSFSKTISITMKRRRPPPRMSSRSFRNIV